MPEPIEPSDKVKKKYDVYAAAKKATSIGADKPILHPTNPQILGGTPGAQIPGSEGLADWVKNKLQNTGNWYAGAAGSILSDLIKSGGYLDPTNMKDLPAGIPFAGSTRLGKVFHSTNKEFKYFDPSRNVKSDILGHFIHFAEDPKAANEWRQYGGQRIIPAHLNVKNAIDLSTDDIDSKDLVKLLNAMHPVDREYAVDMMRRDIEEPGQLKAHLTVYLTQHPEALEKAGFDGVKYHDPDTNESWAVPRAEQIKTPWGTPLGRVNDPKRMLMAPGDDPEKYKPTISDLRFNTSKYKFEEPAYDPLSTQSAENLKKWWYDPQSKSPESITSIPSEGKKIRIQEPQSPAVHTGKGSPFRTLGSEWKKIGESLGTNPGGIYQSSAHGGKLYFKNYADPEQAMNEEIANRLYRDFGGAVPSSALYNIGGKEGIGTGWYPYPTLAKAGGLNEQRAREILKGFPADAFLANWDTIGTGQSNILYPSFDRPMRVDQGGSLLYRAQGAKKTPEQLYGLGEWQNLQNPAINPEYAKVFQAAGIQSPEDIPNVQKHVDKILNTFQLNNPENIDSLSAARGWMLNQDLYGKIPSSLQWGIEDMLAPRIDILKSIVK